MGLFSSTSSPDLNRVSPSLWTVNAGAASFALADVFHDSDDNEFYVGAIRRTNVTAYLSPAQKAAFASYDPSSLNNQLSDDRLISQGRAPANPGSTSVWDNFLKNIADDLSIDKPDSLLNKLIMLLMVLAAVATLWFLWKTFGKQKE